MEILTKHNTHTVVKGLADILNIQLYSPTKNYVPSKIVIFVLDFDHFTFLDLFNNLI